jgi:hypothetical protein
MEIVRVDLTNQKQIRDFLNLPPHIYQGISQWTPPLAGEERSRLDQKRYPFYKHSTAAFFLAYRNDLPVGRLAVLNNHLYNDYNHEKTSFFYLFECEQDPEPARRLFEAAFDWTRTCGLTRILGPKGFTALDGLGLLVKGFERRPAMGLPYNPPYYPELIEALGFEKVNDIVSGYLGPNIQFPERIHELADRVRKRSGLYIARFHTRRELRRALDYLKELYNGALEGTSGGTPITDDEIKSLANQMLWFSDPNLIKIVMKADDPQPGSDRPVGFLLAYPDISSALQKTKGRLFPFGWLTILRELHTTDWININGAGMVQEYRGLGGTAILYSELFKSVIENPRIQNVEIVQIGLENDKMQRELENFGVDFYKMHRTYQRFL